MFEKIDRPEITVDEWRGVGMNDRELDRAIEDLVADEKDELDEVVGTIVAGSLAAILGGAVVKKLWDFSQQLELDTNVAMSTMEDPELQKHLPGGAYTYLVQKTEGIYNRKLSRAEKEKINQYASHIEAYYRSRAKKPAATSPPSVAQARPAPAGTTDRVQALSASAQEIDRRIEDLVTEKEK